MALPLLVDSLSGDSRKLGFAINLQKTERLSELSFQISSKDAVYKLTLKLLKIKTFWFFVFFKLRNQEKKKTSPFGCSGTSIVLLSKLTIFEVI